MKSVSANSPDIGDDCMEDTSNMQSILPSSPDVDHIVPAPQLIPRLGDEYQVEIPPMITESERLQLLKNPADVHDISHSFLVGLPVPLICVRDAVVDGGDETKAKVSELSEESNVIKNDMSDNVIVSRPATSQPVMTGENKKYEVVRGTLHNSWSDADVKSFVLGLFVFGKSFIRIKRFLENKGMGEILSFYYGKFYKSDEHRRWSDCRKIKGRKCTTGQKLFTGWRQHELLSRLIPHVSEESQNSLLQVSKSYVDGRTSLEEYVSSLKSTVGLSVLVEAVGIGKEKEDLTSLSVEPGKNSYAFSISPSIPSGRSWSSLGPGDIINLLTGGFRLSKAKSNDLFWEAVWPRLLARGWHSEQPNSQNYASSKDYLVFLIPGVKKFSRRKLVKGDHYFDSVSDVLSKVVSEPNLLELEVEGTKVGSYNEEDRWNTEVAPDKNGQSDHQGYCYLKPRVGSHKTDHVKFTIVDTSLMHGEKSSHLRQLKSLPLRLKLTPKQTNPLGGKENDSSEKSVGHFDVEAGGNTYKGDKHISKANHRKDVFDSTNQKSIKFTVVDTSLLQGGKLSKVRELRYPPVGMKLTPKMSELSTESDGSSSDNSSEPSMTLDAKKNVNDTVCHHGTPDRDAINQNLAYDDPDKNVSKRVERRESQKDDLSDDDKQLMKTIKQFKRRARPGHSNHAAPPIKRRRLTACAKAETSRLLENSSGGLGSEKSTLLHSSNFPDNNVSYPVDHQENVNVCLDASSAMEVDNKGSNPNKNCPSSGRPFYEVKKCESQATTTLSLPRVPPKSENGDMAEEDGKCQKLNDPCVESGAERVIPNSLNNSCDVCSMEQRPDIINPRRKSTRNRPLTVRALESLANEFLHVQRRPKKKDGETLKDPFSPCRRARSRVKTTLRHSSIGGAAVPEEEKHLTGDCNAEENISRPPDQIEE